MLPDAGLSSKADNISTALFPSDMADSVAIQDLAGALIHRREGMPVHGHT